MSEIGPVQLITVGFGADARYEGKVMEQLKSIEESGNMRVLDILFVRKEEGGELTALDIQGETLGGIVSALIGLQGGSDAPGEQVGPDVSRRDDILDVGDSLEPGQAAGMVLIEHLWARDLGVAIRDTGGTILEMGFLSHEALAQIAPDIAAAAEGN